ncbi:hypothetical protein [Dolichospermum flos-aquae]|uniref:Uncharacterized protein n=1 Tax=Dolichospermum flos-aquae CCAP 1403/13F TaxID=315271 RepID=A0A6H2C4X0_DOLFA|nr:hypothetical protein [Dolichospermum flos-aquae]QJB46256.1 hypothetical protein HGD76_20820 [Dolichospermum flos-aquae CCAP 1403/13F]
MVKKVGQHKISKKSASLVEWLKLIEKLGFYGTMALLKMLFQQKQRLFLK